MSTLTAIDLLAAGTPEAINIFNRAYTMAWTNGIGVRHIPADAKTFENVRSTIRPRNMAVIAYAIAFAALDAVIEAKPYPTTPAEKAFVAALGL